MDCLMYGMKCDICSSSFRVDHQLKKQQINDYGDYLMCKKCWIALGVA